MSWLLFTLTLIGLAFITMHLPWVKKSFLQKPFILFAFLLKVICGSGLVLVYTYYYTDRSSADIYKFFDDASVIAEALPNDPSSYFKLLLGFDESDPQLINYTSRMKNWNPQSSEWLEFTQTQDYNIFQSNRIITRINAALMPLSLGNIFIHVLYFSWLSLICSIAFLNLFSSINHSALVLISVFTLLFPSILVWCSAPLKDTLTLAASSVLLVCMNSLSAKEQRFNLIQILLAFLSVMVIIYTKYYVLIALVPAIILLFLNHQQDKQRKRISIAVFACSIISFVLFAPYISSRIDPVSILNNKREEALKAAIFGEANHLIFNDLIDGKLTGLIVESPQSVFDAIYRPSIIDNSDSPLVKIASLENLFLILLLLPFIFRLFSNRKFSPISFALIVYIIFLAFIIGYTTPVAGGVMRYKTAFLPAYFVVCLENINFNNIIRRFSLIRKISSFVI